MADRKLRASVIIGGLIDSTFKTALTDTRRGFSQLGSVIKTLKQDQKSLNTEMNNLRHNGEKIDSLTDRYTRLQEIIQKTATSTSHLNKALSFKNKMDRGAEQARFMAGRATVGALGGGLIIRNVLQESSKFQTETARLQVMGLPDEAKKQALEAGKSLKNFGTTIRENVELYNDGLAVFGNMHEARIAAPLMAKMKFANKALFGTSDEESERQLVNMLRVIDLRGGASNSEEFSRQANFIQQSVNASHGRVNGSEFFKLISHGGTALKGMSNESLYYKLLPLIQEMGGDQLGTAMQTAYNSLIQGHTSKRAVGNLEKAGLIGEPSKIKIDKNGAAAQLNPGALKGGDLYQRDPTQWVKTVMLPAFLSSGIIGKPLYEHALSGKLNTVEREQLNQEAAKLGNSSTGKFLSTVATSLPQIDRDLKNALGAANIDKSVTIAKNTSLGQENALHAKLTDARLNLGQTILPLYTSALQKANVALDKFNVFVTAHPKLTRAAMVGVVAVTGALAASVPLLFTTAAAMSLYGNVTLLAARRQAVFEAAQLKSARATLLGAEAEETATVARGGLFKKVLNGAGRGVGLFGRGMGLVFRGAGLAIGALFSPIGLTVASLAAGAVLVWKYWRPIKAFFSGVGVGIAKAFSPLKPLFSSLFSPLGSVFSMLSGAVKVAIGWIGELFEPVHQSTSELDHVGEAGKRIGTIIGRYVIPVVKIFGESLGYAIGFFTPIIAFETRMFMTLASYVPMIASGIAKALRSVMGFFTPLLPIGRRVFGAILGNVARVVLKGRQIVTLLGAGLTEVAAQACHAWDKLTAVFDTIWQKIKTIVAEFSPLVQGVQGIFAVMPGKISMGDVGNALSQGATSALNIARGGLEHFTGWLRGENAQQIDIPDVSSSQNVKREGDVHNHYYTITQQPGQSGADLANEIKSSFEKRARPAPSLSDGMIGGVF